MNADILRKAAAKLREHDQAATPGPWIVDDPNEGDHLPFWMVINDAFLNPPADDEDAPWLAVELHTGVEADARLIALMRTLLPTLADVLDGTAEEYDEVPSPDLADQMYAADIALARAILREDTGAPTPKPDAMAEVAAGLIAHEQHLDEERGGPS